MTLQEGVEALRSEGHNPTFASALVELVGRALNGDATGSSAYRVVLYHCETCGSTVRRGTVNEVPVGEESLERVLCNAEVQDEETGHLRRTAPPAIARRVIARAGGGCQVPGCGNRSFLEIHHEGGWRTTGHDPERMLLLCGAHHTARHEDRLRIEGTFSAGFRFSLSDGTPLEEGAKSCHHPVGSFCGSGTRSTVAQRDEGSAPTRTSEVGYDLEQERDRNALPGAHGPPRQRGETRSRSTRSRFRERAEPLAEQGSRELRGGRGGGREFRDARKALRRLGLGKSEVRRLLARTLEKRPELRDGPAGELVRAALAILTPIPRPAAPSGAGSSEELARADRRGRGRSG